VPFRAPSTLNWEWPELYSNQDLQPALSFVIHEIEIMLQMHHLQQPLILPLLACRLWAFLSNLGGKEWGGQDFLHIQHEKKNCYRVFKPVPWAPALQISKQKVWHQHNSPCHTFSQNFYDIFTQKFYLGGFDRSTRGVHIVLKEKPPHEAPLVAIRYRYSRKTVLFFVATKSVRSTVEGIPYSMK